MDIFIFTLSIQIQFVAVASVLRSQLRDVRCQFVHHFVFVLLVSLIFILLVVGMVLCIDTCVVGSYRGILNKQTKVFYEVWILNHT